MNSDKLMEQALGDYFDSLLSESPAPEPEKASTSALALEPELPAAAQAVQQVVAEEVPKQHTPFVAPAASESESPFKQRKPLKQLLAEAEKRIGAPAAPAAAAPMPAEVSRAEPKPLADPTPSVLPVDIPEQRIEVEVAEPEVDVAVELEPESQPPAPDPWQNIEVDEEFQVLFFEAAGVTFGVPLTELGGIHRVTEISPLFGKPAWFAGIMIERERKLSAVDTAKWVLPGKEVTTDYKYLIMLGESAWGLSCEKLHGTQKLNRDDIKWRSEPGKRPWLAGMVKKRMCALLHVSELEAMLEQGVNIEGN